MSFLTQRGPMPMQRQVDQRPVAPVANRYAERPGQSTTNVMGTGPVNNVAGVNMYGQQAPQQSAAQAYFAANPDVQRAFQQNSYGMTPDQFAETHYRNFGQTEGRQWNGQGAIAPPNFSAMTGGQYGNSQQPPMGLLNMTPQQLSAQPQGQAWGKMMGLGNQQAAMQAQNQPNPWNPTGYTPNAQQQAYIQQMNAATSMPSGSAQPAGQPPAWLQPYLGGGQSAGVGGAMPALPGVAQATSRPGQMYNTNPNRAQAMGFGPQPQALGQSANYSPTNRPVSPWYGAGGVNI